MSDRVNDEAFVINPDASQVEIADAINERLAQVESMTFVMSDGGVRQWNEKIQEGYFWALQR
jgi:hypothetical protein